MKDNSTVPYILVYKKRNLAQYFFSDIVHEVRGF